MSVDQIGSSDEIDQPGGVRVSARVRVVGFDQNCEFVAAETAHESVLAERMPNPLDDLAEQLVAKRMAERVVDGFESIEIEQQERRPASALFIGEDLAHALAQARAVGQAGERVTRGDLMRGGERNGPQRRAGRGLERELGARDRDRHGVACLGAVCLGAACLGAV
jgi:hypothetical protein